MFCENCGAKLEEGSLFCQECGTKITYAPTSSNIEVKKEEPVKEELKKEEPVKEEPKKEEPKKEEPKKEEPKKEEPKKEEPKKEEPKKEEPKKEEPVKEETKKEEPKKAAPKKEEPKKEAPKKEAPKKEAPKKETPKKEAPKKSGSALPLIIVVVILVIVLAGVVVFGLILLKQKNDLNDMMSGKSTIEETEDTDDDEKTEDVEETDEEEIEEEPEQDMTAFEDFMSGEGTVLYNGNDFYLKDMLAELVLADESFSEENEIKTALATSHVSYAYCDYDADEMDELVIDVVNSNGLRDGNDFYIVIKDNEGNLECIETVAAADAGDDITGLSYNEPSTKSFDTIDSQFSEAAMFAYSYYISGGSEDNSGEHLTDLKGDNTVDYYFLYSDNNDVPLLVFRDRENLFPPSIVVYYNEQIVRLVFFRKWTFTTVDAGSDGGAYKDFLYTSEMPWGATGASGLPKDMTFYQINSETFGVTTKKVLICSSEDYYVAEKKANGNTEKDTWNDYMKKIHSDFNTEEYLYYYTVDDGFVDDAGNFYESYDAICDSLGATDSYKMTARYELFD